MELTVSLDAQVVIGGDMLHPVRNTLIDLLNIPDESYNEIIENCIAALLNRSDFEFLLSITDHRYFLPAALSVKTIHLRFIFTQGVD